MSDKLTLSKGAPTDQVPDLSKPVTTDPETAAAQARQAADQQQQIDKLGKNIKALQAIKDELEIAKKKPNHYRPPGPIGNTVGVIVNKTQRLPSAPSDARETEQEEWWSKLKEGSKEAAQYYKDNISGPLHSIAGDAMSKGGSVAAAGATVAEVAAPFVETPVGAAVVVGGGVAATAGGAVAAGGAVGETAATAMDKAADAILTGQTPDVVKAAVDMGEKLLTALVLRKLGGLLGKLTKGKGNGNFGGYVVGEGSCIVGPYELIKNQCGTGQQAHHIIPDYLSRFGNRDQGKKGINRIPGMPSFGGGPAICLQGQARVTGSEHNTAHQCDTDICTAAKSTDNGPENTIPVNEAVPMAMKAAIAARPDCKKQIETAVRNSYPNYEQDNRSMNGAGKPAEGDAETHLKNGGSADSNRVGRTGGRRGKI